MGRWHRASCRRPDIYVAGSIPFCSACDASADCASVEPDSESSPRIPLAPELPIDGILHLSWPRSVEYQHEDGDHIGGQRPCLTPKPSFSSPAVPALAAPPSQEVYAPLDKTDHVRLVLLSKGDFDDPIHGTLLTSSLDGGAYFEALSYAWADDTGDDLRRETIFLRPFWNMFRVTANCFAALRRMRKAYRDIMVWVDAVCIDQENHAERNHQVGLMPKIYSSACKVFVYLGEGNKDVEAALAQLRWFHEAKSIDPELIRRLFQCRYFSGMWVIQEVANAKTATIHYGTNSIRWAALAEKRLLSIFGSDNLESVPKWITTIYNQPHHTVSDLAHLLLNNANSDAADTRDRVFALFSLLKNATSHGLVADYSLAVPVIFTGITAFVLLNLGHRWTLELAIGKNTQQLPTWVPDWQRSPKALDRSTRLAEEATNRWLRLIQAGDTLVPGSQHPNINHASGSRTWDA